MKTQIAGLIAVAVVLVTACRKEMPIETVELEELTEVRFSAAYLSMGFDTAKVCRIVLPSNEQLQDTANTRNKLWTNTSLLKVSFKDGSETLQQKVITYANLWSDASGITFEHVNEGGDIRISFDGQSGSWSYVGTDATKVADSEVTMNYGWLTDQSTDEEIRQVVLHEFGHALGLIHEHQRSDVTVDWNAEAVYTYYESYPNYWSREQVDAYVLKPAKTTQLIYNPEDENSIMQMSVSSALTNSDLSINDNTTLSKSDESLISFSYRRNNGVVRSTRLNFNK